MSARLVIPILLVAFAAGPTAECALPGVLRSAVIHADDLRAIQTVCRVVQPIRRPIVRTSLPDTFSFVLEVSSRSTRVIVDASATAAIKTLAESFQQRCRVPDSVSTIRFRIRCVVDGVDGVCRRKALSTLPPDVIVWEEELQQPGSEKVSPKEAPPDVEDFVALEREPGYDERELASNVRYPDIARRNAIQGIVSVGALIGTNGCIQRITIIESDNEILNQSALDAVLSTSFTPAMQNGEPIRVWVRVPLRYALR